MGSRGCHHEEARDQVCQPTNKSCTSHHQGIQPSQQNVTLKCRRTWIRPRRDLGSSGPLLGSPRSVMAHYRKIFPDLQSFEASHHSRCPERFVGMPPEVYEHKVWKQAQESLVQPQVWPHANEREFGSHHRGPHHLADSRESTIGSKVDSLPSNVLDVCCSPTHRL
jgi:hypothetical protein